MADIQMQPGDRNPSRYGAKHYLSAAMLALLAVGASNSDLLHQFLSEKEAVRLTSYRDGRGIWTICEGLTVYDNKAVRPNMHLTKEQCDAADRIFEAKDLREAQEIVGDELWSKLAPRTQAALGSMVHNFGKARTSQMTAVKELRAGHLNEGCAAITLYIFDQGKDCRKAGSNCQGQPTRRMQEDELCLVPTP
jgi:lysozyme